MKIRNVSAPCSPAWRPIRAMPTGPARAGSMVRVIMSISPLTMAPAIDTVSRGPKVTASANPSRSTA